MSNAIKSLGRPASRMFYEISLDDRTCTWATTRGSTRPLRARWRLRSTTQIAVLSATGCCTDLASSRARHEEVEATRPEAWGATPTWCWRAAALWRTSRLETSCKIGSCTGQLHCVFWRDMTVLCEKTLQRSGIEHLSTYSSFTQMSLDVRSWSKTGRLLLERAGRNTEESHL